MSFALWKSFSAPLAEAATGLRQESVRLKLGNIADYDDRDGYDPKFLKGATLALPDLGQWAADSAPVSPAGRHAGHDDDELLYRHFSVKVSKSRRLPFYSAVNIDGAQSMSVPRTNIWKFDPRISVDYQVVLEPYGAEGKGLFSRGHMTRREDPNWGDDLARLKQADADTFHATNAAPQQQKFNAGLWLALENYVLDNTDRENVRASVITGPIFTDTDPVYGGLQVPIAFWKIVAFRHPELKKPVCVAYKRTQASFMPARARSGSRFVFGDFDDTQVSVTSLEEDTGLKFGKWASIDVMREAAPGMALRLTSVEDFILTP